MNGLEGKKLNIKSNLPYMDFRNETDFSGWLWPALDVKTDEDTRIRVFCTQLMDGVVNNIQSKDDVLYHASLFYKIGGKLADRFPHRSEELVDASFTFWEKVQSKCKGMKA